MPRKTTLVTIDPLGDTCFLETGPMKGFSIPGARRKIQRITLVEFLEDFDAFGIRYYRPEEHGCCESFWTPVLLRNTGVNPLHFRSIAFRELAGKSIVTFVDYDEAVRCEVLVIQSLRKAGLPLTCGQCSR